MADSVESSQTSDDQRRTERQPGFATTHWSVILAAGGAGDTLQAQQALSRLCQTYWYPLYAYVRRRGETPQDAEDLTQEFFARLLSRGSLAQVTREGGRFRSFLLKSLSHFLTDEWRRARRKKRGGGQVISLDAASAESRYGLEPADTANPETMFDRAWALALLTSVFHRLREEFAQAGKAAQFDQLKFCLTGAGGAVRYAELAARLGCPENTAKTLVRRLRHRYRDLLRAEVAQTVSRPEDVEEELRWLFRALTGEKS